MYLLDTDILIDIQRGHAPAIARFSSLSEVFSVPGFVVMELIPYSQNMQQVCKALQFLTPIFCFPPYSLRTVIHFDV
jgi:predicted nucleic acid-binding protein